MPLTAELKAGYELVVKDMEAKRGAIQVEVAGLQRKLRELDQNIAGLYRELGVPLPVTVMAVMRNNNQSNASFPADQKYASISVHWAILHLLSDAKAPMATAEIADALTAAGVKTRAANFTNNVSAVLTANMRIRGEEEVEAIEGGWRLTERGRSKISRIVASPKFRKGCPWIVESSSAA